MGSPSCCFNPFRGGGAHTYPVSMGTPSFLCYVPVQLQMPLGGRGYQGGFSEGLCDFYCSPSGKIPARPLLWPRQGQEEQQMLFYQCHASTRVCVCRRPTRHAQCRLCCEILCEKPLCYGSRLQQWLQYKVPIHSRLTILGHTGCWLPEGSCLGAE